MGIRVETAVESLSKHECESWTLSFHCQFIITLTLFKLLRPGKRSNHEGQLQYHMGGHKFSRSRPLTAM